MKSLITLTCNSTKTVIFDSFIKIIFRVGEYGFVDGQIGESEARNRFEFSGVSIVGKCICMLMIVSCANRTE